MWVSTQLQWPGWAWLILTAFAGLFFAAATPQFGRRHGLWAAIAGIAAWLKGNFDFVSIFGGAIIETIYPVSP